ncbi:uncharacterized protein [Apostichopus japonicus]|uniref:uncharacterized protein isoform X3 n=1 Tax=Stichopus japonicus TaxID=307972 RepID=UPI003AB573D0
MLVKVLSNLSEGKDQLSRPTNKSAVERCKIYTLTGQQSSLQQVNLHGWLTSRNDQTSNIHIHEVCHATDGTLGAKFNSYHDVQARKECLSVEYLRLLCSEDFPGFSSHYIYNQPTIPSTSNPLHQPFATQEHNTANSLIIILKMVLLFPSPTTKYLHQPVLRHCKNLTHVSQRYITSPTTGYTNLSITDVLELHRPSTTNNIHSPTSTNL